MENENFLEGKVVFLTGGTGSFGNALIDYIIKNKLTPKKLIIFSRDELKQHEMQQHSFPNDKFGFLRYFIGDIRDKDRLEKAMEGVDIVVHAAALKHVSVAEYNPSEFIKTNIIGTQNLLDIAIKNDIDKFISLSTDKASSPVNLYGATKLCSDKLVISSNNIKGDRKIKFSVVRYGNVFGSRGSVVPLFLRLKKENKLIQITDLGMTRFNISLLEGVEMVTWAIKKAFGGEIIVPKIPSYKISDLIDAFKLKDQVEIIGLRPGEKIHEEMTNSADSYNTLDIGRYFVILQQENNELLLHYKKLIKNDYPIGASYNSSNNPDFLSVTQLENLIEEYQES